MKQMGIVVSGAASGLGRAVMENLAAQGYSIAALDLNEIAADQLPEGSKGYACDVSNASAVKATIAQVGQDFDAITGLVCCAGIAPGSKLVGRSGPHDADLFAKVMAVNVFGTFHLMAECAALMQGNEPDEDGQRGVIVTTASVAAFEGQIGQIAYAASKGAVAAMTLPAARELARTGIRAVSIAPGVFDTPMMQGMPEEVRASIAATVPFPPKLCDPQDFASLVHHIITNKTLNGEVIRLDGALRMAPK
ncbi:SDR family NAD(P)-dependent oxidoreductase [Octadecabacter ascidiaceicola]|uniref:3-oxoacyl-[acyl-carrier-protein] reductase FabG n=1 Tax=Octadecabacter ascidiaceicola TaxID=1655543 RepID=A0A238JK72_9RHOB|nr:SDR family NAD(P)-dependent oxidoreductase [Octadecabacter ascidiaceicola]SMX30885.1 3-oxoacyl-[acyl-carrier-protein] reductase FabG [Octadecabacter ascidiaceicola]